MLSNREIRYLKRTIKKYEKEDTINTQRIKNLNKYLDYYMKYSFNSYYVNEELLDILNNRDNCTNNDDNKLIPGIIV